MTEPRIEAADAMRGARDGAETSFFISYAREDLPFRTRLRTAMLSAGRRVWVDEDIPPLADWREEVLAAIMGADIFVFVLSPDSLVSQACLEELSLAHSSSKRIAPIVCRDVDGLLLPAGLSEPNWVFFRDHDDFDASLVDLLTAADTDVAWVKTHTRLAVRAKDWDERDRDESLLLRGRDLETALVWLAQSAAHGHGDASDTQVEYLEAGRAREADENARLRDQYTRAVARQLAFQSELERGSTPRSVEISALLAAESISRWRTTEGDQALRRAMAQLPVGAKRTVSHDGGQVLALSHDGRVLAVSDAKTVDVWSVESGSLKHTLPMPGLVVTLTIDDGGTRLFGLDDNSHARLWRVSNGDLVHEFDLPGEPEHVALHPDSATVAVACPGHGIQVFDGSRATPVLDCDIDGEVRAMALANDAELLVTVCAEGMTGSLRTFDLTTGQALEPFGFDGLVRSAALARSAAFLAVITLHVGPWMGPERDVNEVSVVTLSEEGLPRVELRHQHPVRAFGFAGDGPYVYTVTDRTVGVWSASNGQPLGSVARASVPCHVALNAAALRLATAYTDGTVRVTDLVSGIPVMAINRQARAVAFDAAGSLVVSETDRTELWGDAVGFELMRARPGVEDGTSPGVAQRISGNVPQARFSLKGYNATICGFSPDGRTLLVEGPNHLLTLLDTSERVVRVLDAPPRASRSAFAADSRHVVTVSVSAAWSSSGDLGDSHVRVWDIGTGALVSEYERPDSPQFDVNERSGLLAHASTDGDQLWVRDSVQGSRRTTSVSPGRCPGCGSATPAATSPLSPTTTSCGSWICSRVTCGRVGRPRRPLFTAWTTVDVSRSSHSPRTRLCTTSKVPPRWRLPRRR